MTTSTGGWRNPGFWAWTSLVAGLLWIILAVLPVPFTTALGLPFAGYAILVGWISRRRLRRNGRAAEGRRGAWAVGLGCGGLVYALVVNMIIGGLLIAGLIGLVTPLVQGTPLP